MENTEHAGVKSARRLRIPEREIHEFKISDVMACQVEARTYTLDVFEEQQGGRHRGATRSFWIQAGDDGPGGTG
jgi:hypothetical protein